MNIIDTDRNNTFKNKLNIYDYLKILYQKEGKKRDYLKMEIPEEIFIGIFVHMCNVQMWIYPTFTTRDNDITHNTNTLRTFTPTHVTFEVFVVFNDKVRIV